MPRRDDHFHPEPSPPAIERDTRSAGAGQVPGDRAVERRHGVDPRYAGPERRRARR